MLEISKDSFMEELYKLAFALPPGEVMRQGFAHPLLALQTRLRLNAAGKAIRATKKGVELAADLGHTPSAKLLREIRLRELASLVGPATYAAGAGAGAYGIHKAIQQRAKEKRAGLEKTAFEPFSAALGVLGAGAAVGFKHLAEKMRPGLDARADRIAKAVTDANQAKAALRKAKLQAAVEAGRSEALAVGKKLARRRLLTGLGAGAGLAGLGAYAIPKLLKSYRSRKSEAK